ncbi:MAG: sulfatase-like hydrolase/transferase [Planctomycetes bacterium]|nr:sulfatase-like hydrolase/transferase [Planctomycetota bacterium]
MHRRAWSVGIVCATLVACSPGVDERPLNVVLISIDTLRADALGAYGESRPTSPTFDAFARDAVVFERALSPAGVTAPAHMSILTSLAPTVHRISNANFFLDGVAGADKPEYARFRLDPRVPTLAQLLANAGYRTGAFVGGGNLNGETGFGSGFETFDDSADNGMNGNRERLFDPTRALEWIEAHRDGPFFAFLHTYVPHSPYLPPPPWDRAFDPDYAGPIPTDRAAFYRQASENYAVRFQRYWGKLDRGDPREVEHLRRAYAGDVRYADDALKTLLDALARLELDERTLVIVLSDHGEEFQEHGGFEHPGRLYVEHTHVPLVFRMPGRAPQRVAAQVSTLDVLPTVLELVGLSVPATVQGTSLVELFDGEGADRPVVSEHVTAWTTNTPDGSPAPVEATYTLRTESWTYLWSNQGREREELYDRRTDPGERVDVHADPAHAAVLERLRAAMLRHREACGALARRFDGRESADLGAETVDELRALGYVK